LCIGRRGREALRREHGSLILDTIENVGRPRLGFADAAGICERVMKMFEAGEFDVCTIIYNHFRSAINQVVTKQQLIPFGTDDEDMSGAAGDEPAAGGEARAVYEFEPDEQDILAELLPRNLGIQIFHALLESAASEQGARMTAMDNATRNAGDMIDNLTLTYNRTRQAFITRELIEIISGAEAI
jgi:F-type H+-transporting ATPase subunit gamma